LALKRRQEGETAFPDLPTIVWTVKDVRFRRVSEEMRAQESAEAAAQAEDRRLHLENYFTFEDVLRDYNEKRRASAEEARKA
jgi:hypothetical protein